MHKPTFLVMEEQTEVQRFPQQEEPELILIHGLHQAEQMQPQQILLPELILQRLQMLMDVL